LNVQKTLMLIDGISTWTGKAFAWTIVALMLAIVYEVVARYVFNAPTQWAFDVSYMLYGTLFMMAGAYTLARNGHVRGDVLYGFLPVRMQAGFDLVLYFVFFIPGIAALAYFGIGFAQTSWSLGEHSSLTPGGPPVYHFKTLIPIAGALVLLQGVAEIIRCILALKTGEWPRRLHDVEEVDVAGLKGMVEARSAGAGLAGDSGSPSIPSAPGAR
jgi:TRAP-type mannitol/chloroaromatic compound transport system permease small subunit